MSSEHLIEQRMTCILDKDMYAKREWFISVQCQDIIWGGGEEQNIRIELNLLVCMLSHHSDGRVRSSRMNIFFAIVRMWLRWNSSNWEACRIVDWRWLVIRRIEIRYSFFSFYFDWYHKTSSWYSHEIVSIVITVDIFMSSDRFISIKQQSYHLRKSVLVCRPRFFFFFFSLSRIYVRVF